ncbi:MAG: VOC family protein [Proteobacteria bacterium]|nr:VOC family protein [Pseudomonadota bacterium]HQR03716.1 VOC family protein [Rhodocyclaceae bacterium]
MIDHVSISTADYPRSKAFYLAALAPLGYSLLVELTAQQTGDFAGAGFGVAPKPDFWIGASQPQRPPVHVAFRAASRDQVNAFYRAALAAGGRDNGAPGLRPQYHPHYYGAFVLDPDGHNIEAVCHEPA